MARSAPAHELNNPISFLMGNVRALQRYTERLRQYLAAVHADEPAAERAALRAKVRCPRCGLAARQNQAGCV